MESEKVKLVPSVENEESVFEQNDEMEYLKNDTIINLEETPSPIEGEEENFGNRQDIIENEKLANSDIPISENNVNGENVSVGPALIDTLDIYNILNTTEIFSKSDIVFDVANSKTFRKLQPETDLNVPPANWLNPTVNLPNPIKIKIKTEESASFPIANMFPECNNRVDIIADADVIKQILKIPYNKEYVSVMVRKIGNVLLIDNFDIKSLSSNNEDINENNLNENKEYLAKLKEIHSDLRKTNNSNKRLRQRNLYSKFLFRSVLDDPEAPEHLPSTESEEAGRVHTFNRIIYWSFGETQMIIGTNMLKTNLFEDGTNRNVSLHVARAEKPLKILNAIDMWLDNLICDIPEAVICFQSNGIVQRYECVKTQDIPYLPASQFSVTKIKTAVQKIFSFLRNQEYKTGHVYWLLKCKNDNVFKFIDLNMSERTDGQVKMMKTKFPYECGKLSYRFGHNQYYHSNNRKELNDTLLLDASITTLNSKIHPEIIASANYLIVDSKFSYEIFKTSLFTLSKVEFGKCKKEPESVRKNCLDALGDISNGLQCLEYFCVSENSQNQNLTKSVKTNNIGNIKFKKDKKQAKDEFFYINVSSLFPKKEHRVLEVLPTWENINEDRDYWKNYLKFLFYQKAELIYGILAQEYFYNDMFELCLLSLDMMVRFNKVKTKIDPSSHTIPFNFVLVMAGDCCKLASTIDLSEDSDCNLVTDIEDILIIDEQYYKINPNNYNLHLNLKDYSQCELVEMAVAFYGESWKRIWSGRHSTEIDENITFIIKKFFVSNLALAVAYFNMLDKSRKESNYKDYFEQSKKYLNSAIQTAASPTEKALAVFHLSELHGHLFCISLNKALPSCEEKNLLVYFTVFLDSFKDTLQILYDANNAECGRLWSYYFYKSFRTIETILTCFSTNRENKIFVKLRHLIIERGTTALKEILKKCELSSQRYKDDSLELACAITNKCIANNLCNGMKIGFRSNFITIRDHYLKAFEYFSQNKLWRFYIPTLVDLSDFTWNHSQDQFDFPLKMKMENIRYCLKLCYQASIKLQEISFKDEPNHNIFQKYLPELHSGIQYLLCRGTEFIEEDSRIAKTEFDELQTFNNYLKEFRDINNGEYKLYFTTIVSTLNQMGISMKFAK